MNVSYKKSELYTKNDEADKRMCAHSTDLASNYRIKKSYSLCTSFLHHDIGFWWNYSWPHTRP
jgi:hypothetical protein